MAYYNRIHNVVPGISPIQCELSFEGYYKELVGIIVTDLFCLGILFVNLV